ncbi:hypothetical protein [Nostoc sp.]|uniref:hypothetical protein n=1 Tax=Nostoc sp. TaxID=1180 RepID=UPI002FFC2D13
MLIGYVSLRLRLREGKALMRSRLLTRIYPFESFLSVNGKPVIEYEVWEGEVKKGDVLHFNLKPAFSGLLEVKIL